MLNITGITSSPIVSLVLLIIGLALGSVLRIRRGATPNRVKLKPGGHNGFVEGLIPAGIGIGFFSLAIIAAYSFAYDEAQRLLTNHGSISDIFLVAIAGFLGALNGVATSVAATRWRIHSMRKDPDEQFYQRFAKLMFWLCFGVEALTLNYFLYRLTPASYPNWMGSIIDFVHASMAISRGFLIPLDLAFLAAFLADLIISLKDRKRGIQSFTGQRMLVIEQRLTDDEHPLPDDQLPAVLATYETLVSLNEFASDAQEDEREANATLYAKICAAKKVIPQSELEHLVKQDGLEQRLTALLADVQGTIDAKLHAVAPDMSATLAAWRQEMLDEVYAIVESSRQQELVADVANDTAPKQSKTKAHVRPAGLAAAIKRGRAEHVETSADALVAQ